MAPLMIDDELVALEQVCGFLSSAQPLVFKIHSKDECTLEPTKRGRKKLRK